MDRNGLPLGNITQDFLRTRFEAHLQYPGARVFRSLGADQKRNYIEGGSSSGFVGAILIAPPGTGDAIYPWYHAQLYARGWTATGILPGGPTISQAAYKRGDREGFVIGIDDPRLLGNVIGGKIPSGETIFEERYIIDPPN